jgi:membrane protease YdiL (CAAX protease family)
MTEAVTKSAPTRSWVGWFPRQWAAIDAETLERRPFGAFEAGLLVVAAIALVFQRFPGRGDAFQRTLEPDSTWFDFADQLQWGLGTSFAYIAIPLAYLALTRAPIRDYNLSWRGTQRHLPMYLAMLVLMGLPILIVSATGDYQRIYPFYDSAHRSWTDLIAWELVYGLQFVGLEFFFRGFLLHGLRPALGHAAIFVMVVPYCMLHFGKTWSESLAAIVAGIILGTLAMRWRSIWGGVLIHWTVAISMDAASLLRQGRFPPGELFPPG